MKDEESKELHTHKCCWRVFSYDRDVDIEFMGFTRKVFKDGKFFYGRCDNFKFNDIVSWISEDELINCYDDDRLY